MGLDFAAHLLKRLQTVSSAQEPATDGESAKADVEAEEVQQSDAAKEEPVLANGASEADPATNTKYATVQGGEVMSGLPSARTETEVAQHIELLFGLVSKSPELLDRQA